MSHAPSPESINTLYVPPEVIAHPHVEVENFEELIARIDSDIDKAEASEQGVATMHLDAGHIQSDLVYYDAKKNEVQTALDGVYSRIHGQHMATLYATEEEQAQDAAELAAKHTTRLSTMQERHTAETTGMQERQADELRKLMERHELERTQTAQSQAAEARTTRQEVDEQRTTMELTHQTNLDGLKTEYAGVEQSIIARITGLASEFTEVHGRASQASQTNETAFRSAAEAIKELLGEMTVSLSDATRKQTSIRETEANLTEIKAQVTGLGDELDQAIERRRQVKNLLQDETRFLAKQSYEQPAEVVDSLKDVRLQAELDANLPDQLMEKLFDVKNERDEVTAQLEREKASIADYAKKYATIVDDLRDLDKLLRRYDEGSDLAHGLLQKVTGIYGAMQALFAEVSGYTSSEEPDVAEAVIPEQAEPSEPVAAEAVSIKVAMVDKTDRHYVTSGAIAPTGGALLTMLRTHVAVEPETT